MKSKGKCFLVWLLTVVTSVASGQAEGVIRQELPTRNVMTCNGVNRFLRDSEGYVWYATEEGLCRDNGYQVDVFCSRERNLKLMKSNYVTDIAEDGKGHIWIGTSQGAYVLDKQDYGIHPVAVPEAQGIRIEAFCALHDGTVWLSTGNHLMHFDADEQLIEKIDISGRRHGSKFVNAFVEDSHHTLWLMASGVGMLSYDSERRDFVPAPWLPGFEPQGMAEDVVNGCYWVGLWGQGIYRYRPNAVGGAPVLEAQPATVSAHDPVTGWIWDIRFDPQGKMLWATDVDGLFAYTIDSNGQLRLCDEAHIPAQTQHESGNITVDDLGIVWVGGMRYFMVLRSKEGIVRHNLPEQVAAQRASIDANRKQLIAEVKQHLPQNGINDACVDVSGNVWAATDHGVKRMARSTWNVEQVTDSTDDVLRMVIDANGCLYYQGRRDGLCRLPRGHRQAQPMLKEGETCSCLAMLDGDVLWIGTSTGRVYSYGTGRDTTMTHILPLSNTQGHRILEIRQDAQGHVWSMTKHSLREWDGKNDRYRLLQSRHPMIGLEYFDAIAVAGDSICAIGPGAYCMIATKDFDSTKPSNSQPMVSTIVIDGEDHYVGLGQTELDIPSNARLVEIRLTTLRHHIAPQVQFAYRLHKSGWIDKRNEEAAWAELPTGTNTIMLSSPAKGSYVLEVKATDGQGIWEQPVDVFELHRLPAWWESGWAYAIYAICLLALAVWMARQYSAYVRRRRMSQMEEQLSKMKFRFFTNISHELRTPLTLMLVPVEQMLANNGLPARDRERLQTIQRNAQELEQLINHMLDFRRMELGNVRLNMRNGDLSALMKVAVESFQPLAGHKEIALRFEPSEGNYYAMFDHEKMRHVLWNLLSNAMKFTPQGGSVTLTLAANAAKDELTVHVKDTGTGIPEAELSHIFDRYYQSANSAEHGGSGIGLHIVKEMVRLHGGQVGVSSQEGHGADFWFTLPVRQPDSLKKGAERSEQASALQESQVTAASPTGMVGGESSPTILLVEDNVELRSLIANQLSDDGYAIQQAGDGQQAWDLLQQNDEIMLIISDVMMPVMDGMELCRRVKTNERTSHLPIILLTAKTGDDSRLEGYKMGADSYITKPFSMAVLQNRIKHLLEQRQSQQQQFQHDGSCDAAPITHSPFDEEFLARAILTVQNHLSDKDYGVNQFSDDMCASRMTLYRKVHGITGQSPSEFITTIRLKHAAHLLETSTLSIALVSEQTGFSSPSFFTKQFSKMFGCLPKDYRTKKGKE